MCTLFPSSFFLFFFFFFSSQFSPLTPLFGEDEVSGLNGRAPGFSLSFFPFFFSRSFSSRSSGDYDHKGGIRRRGNGALPSPPFFFFFFPLFSAIPPVANLRGAEHVAIFLFSLSPFFFMFCPLYENARLRRRGRDPPFFSSFGCRSRRRQLGSPLPPPLFFLLVAASAVLR